MRIGNRSESLEVLLFDAEEEWRICEQTRSIFVFVWFLSACGAFILMFGEHLGIFPVREINLALFGLGGIGAIILLFAMIWFWSTGHKPTDAQKRFIKNLSQETDARIIDFMIDGLFMVDEDCSRASEKCLLRWLDQSETFNDESVDKKQQLKIFSLLRNVKAKDDLTLETAVLKAATRSHNIRVFPFAKQLAAISVSNARQQELQEAAREYLSRQTVKTK